MNFSASFPPSMIATRTDIRDIFPSLFADQEGLRPLGVEVTLRNETRIYGFFLTIEGTLQNGQVSIRCLIFRCLPPGPAQNSLATPAIAEQLKEASGNDLVTCIVPWNNGAGIIAMTLLPGVTATYFIDPAGS